MSIIFYTFREPVFKTKKSNHKKLLGVKKKVCSLPNKNNSFSEAFTFHNMRIHYIDIALVS